jgi:acyl-CoA synthetase (AMP-forming)/AMP-acid ligase II
MPTIPYYDWLAHHADRRPAKLAIHDLQIGRKLSYSALHDRANRLAAAMLGLGVAKGDRGRSSRPTARSSSSCNSPAAESAPSWCCSTGD